MKRRALALGRIRSGRGFTLIELLVVIAIIGILAAIVIVNVNGARVKSRDTKRKGDVKQLQTALGLYYDANSDAYPAALSSLQPSYISTAPKDPKTGSAYVYGVSGDNYAIGVTFEALSPASCKYMIGSYTTSPFDAGGTYKDVCSQ